LPDSDCARYRVHTRLTILLKNFTAEKKTTSSFSLIPRLNFGKKLHLHLAQAFLTMLQLMEQSAGEGLPGAKRAIEAALSNLPLILKSQAYTATTHVLQIDFGAMLPSCLLTVRALLLHTCLDLPVSSLSTFLIPVLAEGKPTIF
jgi:hypothetical protein